MILNRRDGFHGDSEHGQAGNIDESRKFLCNDNVDGDGRRGNSGDSNGDNVNDTVSVVRDGCKKKV